MVLLAQQQPHPQSEVDVDDFALADSFINFDYVPDSLALSTRVDEPIPEPEPKLETLGCWGGIKEGIEKINFVGKCENLCHIANMCEISESDSAASSSSSSSSSSSASSSSDSEDGGDVRKERKRKEEVEVEEGEIVDSDCECARELEERTYWSIDDDDDDDDDDEDSTLGRPIRSKNELEILPPVPPVKVTLKPHHQMLPVGVIMSVLGVRVIVEGVEKHDPLDEGSILWITENRTPLGSIDEIFGPVQSPYYVVRYNSEKDVPKGIHEGTLVSFVPDFANHVLHNNNDLYKKGYDTSNWDDEEDSNDAEFSDDEKEAEFKRMQNMTKRGSKDQNPRKKKNKGKKFLPQPQEGSVVPSFPVPSATPLHHDHGPSCSPFSGIAQGLPPFPSTNAGPNSTTNGVWTNGTTTLHQPQSVPNGFPANGMSWYPPASTQISPQLALQGIPFQQQQLLNPNPPATMFPGVQPNNIFAQLMYTQQGLMGQNQMTFGLNSPFPQIQPPMCGGQQGFYSTQLLQSEINHNLHSSSVPFNHNHVHHHQFNTGASANHGRRNFHRWGRKGRPPNK